MCLLPLPTLAACLELRLSVFGHLAAEPSAAQGKTAAMPHPCWPAGCWIASAIETFPANYSSSSNESQWQHAKLTHTHRASSSGGVGGDPWQLKIVLETIVTQASYRSRDSE